MGEQCEIFGQIANQILHHMAGVFTEEQQISFCFPLIQADEICYTAKDQDRYTVSLGNPGDSPGLPIHNAWPISVFQFEEIRRRQIAVG